MAQSEPQLPPDATVPQAAPATPDTLDSPNTNSDRKAPVDPSTADFLAPAQEADELGRLGPYRVLSELGKGGMGAVYLASDPKLKRQVALKVMLPQYAANEQAKRRFLREAEAQAAVEHDHIITIYQVGEENGIPFIAMPLLKGRTLAEALKRNPTPPITHVLRIAREMAEGLAAAHERGLMHRDIKPGNVWLEGKNLRVKILDFGLARTESEASEDEPLTQTGVILGTPHYMSPEQAHGHGVDHRTDLFSLGVVMYFMTTGKLPFTGTSTMAVLTALATKTPPSPRTLRPECPERLDRLILDLLAKEPADRPPTADDVAETIRQIEDDLGKTHEAPQVVAVPLIEMPSKTSDPWESIDATEPGAVVRVTSPDLQLATKAAKTKQPVKTASVSAGRAVWWTIALGILIILGGTAALYKFVLETPQGSLVVEIDDPEVETRFKDGELKLYDSAGKLLYTLKPQERDKKLPPGDYRIKVTGADGLKVDVPEFKIEKNGKATVRVYLEKRAVAKKPEATGGPTGVEEPPGVEPKETPAVTATDPHRRVAEGGLKNGGKVWVLTARTKSGVSRLEELPNEPFVVVTVSFLNVPITNDSLKSLDGLSYLGDLVLNASKATDEGISHLHDLTALNVDFGSLAITDQSAAFLSTWPELNHLQIHRTPISDAAIPHLLKMRHLRILHIGGTKITDAGLKELAAHPSLRSLTLTANPITPAGLAHLKELKSLQWLALNDFGDDAIDSLKNLTQLRILAFPQQRKPTDEAVRKLQQALPNTVIVHPALSPTEDEKRAVQWALDQKASINGGNLKEVPSKTFSVKYLFMSADGPKSGAENLRGIRHIELLSWGGLKNADAEAEHLVTLDTLVSLMLGGSDITAKGLEKLTAIKSLEQLQAGECISLTDDAMVHIPKFKHLWILALNGCPITDVGLEHLARAESLYTLGLGECSKITGAGVKHLAALPILRELNLSKTALDDTAVPNLKLLTQVRILDLKGTKITAAGIAELQKALPKCAIFWDGGLVVPGAAPIAVNRKADFTNSIGMEFMKVPKGTGWLGGGGGKPGEKKVEFKEDFYLGKYEVTQEEWEKVMGSNPSHFSRTGEGKEAVKDIPDADLKRFPVEIVSWDDCQLFIKKLNEKEKYSGWMYRLPSEAEWEYACRGGPVDKADSAFNFYFAKPTNTLLPEQANFSPLVGMGLHRTCKVGSYESNLLGLYDMHGNVSEWCHRPDETSLPAFLGGRWQDGFGSSWPAWRITNPAGARAFSLGLRLARVPVVQAGK